MILSWIFQVLSDVVGFVCLFLFRVPFILVNALFSKNSAYSLADIPRLLFLSYPILTSLTIVGIVAVLIDFVGIQQDQFRASHEDSKTIAFFDRLEDALYVTGDRVFKYAEKRESQMLHPNKVKQLYYKYLESDTHRAKRYHRFELNHELIMQRQATKTDKPRANRKCCSYLGPQGSSTQQLQ